MRDYNNLRQWLTEKLELKGMSVEKLANAAGLSRAAIYFYFTDTCRPETQTMARICEVLGAPLEEGLKQYTPKKKGKPSHRAIHAH